MSAITTTSASARAWYARPELHNAGELAGRVLLGGLFLLSGLMKLPQYSVTAQYMATQGVPSFLLPLVILTECLGGLAVILGWQTRVAAFLLAGFTFLAALIFHSHFSDQAQMTMFMEHLAIIGGFLLLVGRGAGPLSLEQRPKRQGT